MEAKQYTTKQPMDHWRNQRGNQIIPRDKWKHDDPKPMGCSKSNSKRRVYTSLHQEARKILNKPPNLMPKTIRERRTKKPQS